jgi:hypothetical protein
MHRLKTTRNPDQLLADGGAGAGLPKDHHKTAALKLKNSGRRKINLALQKGSWPHYLMLAFALSAIIILYKFNFVTQNNEQHTETADQQIENQLMEFFDRTAVEQVNPDSSINKLISLRTSGNLQAGFGNIMVGVIAVIMESFVSERFPIINNCIILNMFQHPNPSLSFLSNNDDRGAGDESKCAFDERQLEKYTPIPNNITNKKQVNNQAVVQDMRKDGVMKKYASMLESIDEGDPRLYDMVSSAAARWMMQRLTPLFQSLVDKEKKRVLSQCENATKIDFAIQIRTWRDFPDLLKRPMYTEIRDEIEDCIRGRLANMLHKSDRAMTSETKACVYITSDDPMEMKSMADRMFDTNDRVNFVISHRPASDDAWHSADSFAKHKSEFDPKLLAKHEELIDWMIFGEAEEAIYTLRSTFGRTSRMRRGYGGQRNDFVVGSTRSGVNKEFVCNPVQGVDLSLMEWSGFGTLAFKKRKTQHQLKPNY